MQKPRSITQGRGTGRGSGHRWRAAAATIATMTLLATLGACGGPGETPSSLATASKSRTATRASALAATYVPATATCSSTPGPSTPAPSPISSSPVHVSGYRVCGPFTATRGTSSFECPLPAGAMGPYRLLVYNGNADGTGPASSATVLVDGVEVLSSRSFDQTIGAATSRVTLASLNTIGTVIRNDGGSLRLAVVDEGQACSILKPVDVTSLGFETALSSLNPFSVPEFQLFNGGADALSPTNAGEVSFNGVPLITRSAIREKVTAVLAPLTLAPPNTLSARAGQKGLFSMQVVDRDETPPHFTIASPANVSFTNQRQLVVSGAIDDPSAGVTVNGAAATVGGGSYTGQASLVECWNTVIVRASDACTNTGEARVRVGLDTVPPVLGLMSPPSGLLTNQPIQPVVLRYSDNFSGVNLSSLRVLLDGVDVTGALTIGADSATGSLTPAEGSHTLHAQVSDRAGNVAARDSSFVVDLTPPVLAIVAPKDGSTSNQSTVAVTITYSDALSGVDPSTFAVSLDGEDITKSFAVGPVSASSTLNVTPGAHQLDVQIADLATNIARGHASFTATNASAIPPDPSTVAPPNDPTVATDIFASTSFLYSGSAPIQTGVAPGTIEARRVAVTRGRVAGRDGSPISGVNIRILGHPEFGSTLTRIDGAFDIAVNGGGLLTVTYQKDGFLPAQRQVRTPWRDYVRADDVVLVPFDTAVAAVALGSPVMQVVRGSPVTDADGTRQATVLFPSGTNASMVMPDGTTQPLAAMHVRATEYTVGPTGPKAMPAALPPTSGYTYAVELSADEAVMAGAPRVQFDRPVVLYVDNFLSFPVGGIVPAGYYDRTRSVWIPSDNGRVVTIVGITGGLVELDTSGSGVAADAATLVALGVTSEERARLAATYSIGASLWRVPIRHLTPWDCNWPFGCKGGAVACPAPNPPPPPPPPPDDPCKQSGSIIECETQALGEQVPISGTNLDLTYTSRRARGYTAERRAVIPLVGAAYAPSLDSVNLTVDIAGQHHALTFAPSPNLTYTFEWDGKDGFGRDVIGSAEAYIEIAYAYSATYLEPCPPTASYRAFALPSYSVNGIGGRTSPSFRVSVPIQYARVLRGIEDTLSPMAGWDIGVHHARDQAGRRLLLGDGSERAQVANNGVITTVAGTGATYGGDGGPATAAGIVYPSSVAVGPDGAFFIAEYWGSRVRRVGPDGVITTVAGSWRGFGGDDGPATAARLAEPTQVAVGPDGALFIADSDNFRIRRVGPDGIISTVAGTGTYGYSGDGGPATAAQLSHPSGVAIGSDGSLFISDSNNYRIRRVGPDGIISTVAGSGASGFGGDGGPAILAAFDSPAQLAAGLDGAVFIADSYDGRIRRVGPDGIITTVAGAGPTGYGGGGYSGDGGPATAAGLLNPSGVAVAPDVRFSLLILRIAGYAVWGRTASLPRSLGQGRPVTMEGDTAEMAGLQALPCCIARGPSRWVPTARSSLQIQRTSEFA